MRYFILNMMVLASMMTTMAQVETPLSPLHVEGRHLVDNEGNCVTMRGVMYGPHPYFNNGAWGSGWSDTDVKNCLAYFDKVFTALTDTAQGSYCNMWRVPWEEYWCVEPGIAHSGTNTSTWNEEMALKYLDKLFIPLIENAVSKGLYVVFRPTYGNPGDIQVGDDYQKHLCYEWKILASHPRLQALSGYVSFELLNEPTVILDENGEETAAALAGYMQPMIDTIRHCGFDGIIWSSGLAFQTKFRDYLTHPVTDDNLGYAVHIYPGWFCQNDNNADGERLVSSFKYEVPVLETNPIVITEVDWSPEKEGEGRVDEFGNWIPSNWGSWGTGSTSKWGKAFKYMLEYNKNISVAIGAADEYFDISQYLKDGTLKVWFEGNSECSAQAAFDWYKEWAHLQTETPAVRDRLSEEILGKTPLSTIEQLTSNLFEMVLGTNIIFYINTANVGGWDMLYGSASSVVNAENKAYLFKAHPVKVDSCTYYTLKCYNEDGTLRMSALDGGCGDGINITTGTNNVLFEGSTRENGPFIYGQDLDYGALWDIQEVDGGFRFRSVSANNKYIGVSGQSTKASTWKCYSRYSFWSNRNIPYQRISEQNGQLHTVCVPYKATFSDAEVYDVAGVDNPEQPTRVYLNRISDEQTQAGHAYVLRSTSNQDINAQMAASSLSLHSDTDNSLIGVFAEQQAPAGIFILQDGQWRQVIEGSEPTLKAYQAYLDLSKTEMAASGDLVMEIGKTASGIPSVKIGITDDTYYSLNGQRVKNPTKGIYIKNGQIIIIQ